ncbi:MAG: caspase family protein [Thermoguttaceae bacterium]|nr:caspase family protein [Thermoguttaceae bacterium]
MMKKIILTLLLFLAAAPAFADVKALLLSLEQYKEEKDVLAYVENDLKELSNALERIHATITSSIDSDVGPNDISEDRYRKSILNRIDQWLKDIGDKDIAMVYLAGHGVKDDKGKLYWAMNNFDPKNFGQTAIPVGLIREKLESCRASKVLLFLDTCFYGTAKSAGSKNLVVVSTMAESFKKSSKLTTIASSSANQESWLWKEMEHSLFTFWLIQAFKGAADEDGNGSISYSELKDFLDVNVMQSAKLALEKKQTPTYFNDGALLENDFALPVKAVTLQRLYEDIADQIDIQMRLHGFKRLAVTEFSSGENQNKVDGQTGLLTKDAAHEITSILSKRKKKFGAPYTILTENATNELLKNGGIAFDDLGASKTKNLLLSASAKVDEHDNPAIFTGNLRWTGACGLRLSGRLISTETMEDVFVVRGLGLLGRPLGSRNRLLPDYEQLGMSGLSMLVPTYNDNRDKPYVPTQGTPHPLNVSAGGPQTVKILVRPHNSNGPYKLRELKFSGNRCDVKLNQGEQYAIRITNTSKQEVFARVLVDGRSTISQYVNVSKDECLQGTVPKSEKMIFAPRVNLQEARQWYLPPETYCDILGFYAPEGLETSDVKYLAKDIKVTGKSQLCRFNVVDANESLAARDHFTDQLGMITVAIYESIAPEEAEHRKAKRGEQNVGTNPGPPEATKLGKYTGKNVPGDPTMILNIHYSSK